VHQSAPERGEIVVVFEGNLIITNIDEVKYVVERWQMDYNHYRPHSSLSYMTPAAFAQSCQGVGCIRSHTPMPDEKRMVEILSETLDQ